MSGRISDDWRRAARGESGSLGSDAAIAESVIAGVAIEYSRHCRGLVLGSRIPQQRCDGSAPLPVSQPVVAAVGGRGQVIRRGSPPPRGVAGKALGLVAGRAAISEITAPVMAMSKMAISEVSRQGT